MSDQLKKKKIDPSDSRQNFTDISINLHCCRYWICTEWEFTNMAFPFWRIYHNQTSGARILFNGKTTELTDDKIVVIPPNTSFSSYLKNKELVIDKENIIGRKVESEDDIANCKVDDCIDHLFIHFNLGLPFDFVKPGIYTMANNEKYNYYLKNIKQHSIYGGNVHDFKSSMLIHIFILSVLEQLPNSLWFNDDMDKRIMNSLQYIRNNIDGELSNTELAKQANMATNSFSRLFKENTGESLQHYVIKSRIENACLLLHHSDKSIDIIASECGFCDRHHFSKIFKQQIGMAPGYYKNHVILQ